MAKIILATLNAKYIHCSFGLRYLLANLGTLRSDATLMEFEINQRPFDIAERLLTEQVRVVAFGVYIWNVEQTRQVIATLKRLRPDLWIVLGGPEVSYETDQQAIVELADYVITGEADLAFPELCRQLLSGVPPREKVVVASLPSLANLTLPYDLYTDQDAAHRVVYVEASRGCPFSCEFCLSSLDIPLRQFPLQPLLNNFESLLQRGVRQFKFVDRTFNLNLQVSLELLQFFLQRYRPDLFLHFEMIPDRLPEALRDLIARFPAGSLQFEIGIQSFHPAVCELISRRQDFQKVESNLRFLREQTGVHIHADLIAGLPGESLESFGAGFDRLLQLRPHEIQVGILKRLRGTPIIRHDAAFAMVYAPDPPYEVLRTRHMDFHDLQRLRQFARYWDLIYNSGRFPTTAPLLWRQAPSPFFAFLNWSDWLFGQIGRRHGIALNQLARFLFKYLTHECAVAAKEVATAFAADFVGTASRDIPPFLREHLCPTQSMRQAKPKSAPPPMTVSEPGRNIDIVAPPAPLHARRQQRHRRVTS